MHSHERYVTLLSVTLCFFVLFGCAVKEYSPTQESEIKPWEEGSAFGGDGITLFSSQSETAERTSSLGTNTVNSFLWHASLTTLSFLPITSADPFGGLIITDWYAAPEVPNERFKLNVYILSPYLRADGLKISVFRQIKESDQWNDAPVSPDTAIQLENLILTQARHLWIQYSQERG